MHWILKYRKGEYIGMLKYEEFRIRPNELVNEMERTILKKIGKKKLVAYGASSRWPDINRIIYLEDLVEFFVDGDRSKWGQKYFGKEIKNPEEIKKLDLEEYAVVVTSAAFEQIQIILDDMGLKKDVNYFNIFQYLYIIEGRPFGSFNKFMKFLDTVPDDIRKVEANKGSEKIGIVLSVEGFSRDATDIPYLVSLFLILKWRGYLVKLIVDRLRWEGDIVLYEGRGDVCEWVTDMLVDRLERIVPSKDILYITEEDTGGDLTQEDEQECERIAEYSAKWLKWQALYNPRFISEDILRDKLAAIYKRNFPCIEAFFDRNHFDTINASTALHVRGGVYNYVGKKKGIRVSSSDGIGGTTCISAYGPNADARDIPHLIKGDWLSGEESEILESASDMWGKRKELPLSVHADTTHEEYVELKKVGYSNIGFQSSRATKIKAYDVIIPLNIKNDGAALGMRTIFKNREQWIIETLDFVINRLGKTVLIREHPAARILQNGEKCTELYAEYPEILAPYQGNPSLYYVTSKEDINIYQYIERCKVVIPWTSTVGIEAGLLKKNVLVHTEVFYNQSLFTLYASFRDEYFEILKNCLMEDKYLIEDEKEAYRDALKYFYFSMRTLLVTDFTSLNADFSSYVWKFNSFDELINTEGVEETIQIIAEAVPSVYLIDKQHKRIYQE